MNKDKIFELLACLNAKKIKPRDKWVVCSCPFSPWEHGKEVEGTPAFGIKIEPTGMSFINCYSCGAKGDLLEMVLELHRRQKKQPYLVDVDWKKALAIAEAEEESCDLDVDVPAYDILQNKKPEEEKPIVPFPEAWLASFMKYPNHKYVQERGISLAVAMALDVRYDMSENRICFPIRDKNGVLVGLHGRYAAKDVPVWALKQKMYDYKGQYNVQVWLNENNLDFDKPVVMLEGTIDLAHVFEVYTNVVGSLTSQISVVKAKRLRDVSNIITFYDYGTGGDHGRVLVEKYWPKAHITHIIPTKDEGDAGAMTKEQIADVLLPLVP